jgi:hypothetical protein
MNVPSDVHGWEPRGVLGVLVVNLQSDPGLTFC